MRNQSGSWSAGASCTTPRQLRIAWLSGILLLAGCTAQGSTTPGLLEGLLGPSVVQKAAHRSDPDSEACAGPAQCKGVLKTMIDSPDRGWIGKRQSPNTYANGTRLFAYRALRKRLTCNELALAVEEVRATSKSLGGSVPGMPPDQKSRTRALSSAVADELATERAGRCRS